jgi:hypothetical protein
MCYFQGVFYTPEPYVIIESPMITGMETTQQQKGNKVTETVNKSDRNKIVAVIRNSPMKTKASVVGMMLGLAGCAGFPIGSTVRLICGTATGIMDVVDKVKANDAGSPIPANPFSTLNTRDSGNAPTTDIDSSLVASE